MQLIDVVNAPWAIPPQMLLEIQDLYIAHTRRDKIDISAIEADLGRPFSNKHRSYAVNNGVAILTMDGVIAKKMNLFTRISGGISSELVARDFQAAMDDAEVEAIVISMDSPGGTVDGTPELAELIYNSRGQKPIYGHSTGMVASAMYWIGSAVDKINISSDVVMVGSIGVVASHVDVSRAEDRIGRKTTEITAGKYKRIASNYEPLSEEGRADIQAMVDYIYSAFVNDVAKHRGVSVEDVLKRMADGKDFLGRQAIEAGLVDGVATMAETIDEARAAVRGETIPNTDGASGSGKKLGAGVASTDSEETSMKDLKQFKTDHPEEVAAIVAGAQVDMGEKIKAAQEAGKVEGIGEGAQAEASRVADVRTQLVPGHEALIETLAADGKTTGAEAAQAIIKAENKARGDAAADLDDESNSGAEVVVDAPGKVTATDGPVTADKIQAEWDADASLQAEFSGDFDAYSALRTAQGDGLVKVSTKK